MRRLPLAVLLALTACEAPPPPSKSAAATTIQHDAPNPVTAPPLPQEAEAGQLPSNHPKLGDGAKDHDAELPNGHPATGQEQNPDAKELLARVEAMKDQLKGKPKTVEITVALGSLYYDNGKYLDAIDFYRQAIAQSDALVKRFQAVRAAAGKAAPAELAKAGCDRQTIRDSEPMMARAEELRQKGDLAGALACAQEAVRPVVMAHTRRGNAFYLVGNASDAVAEHEKALELDPREPESLFFRGAILFDSMGDDVAKLKRAKESWQQFLAAAPDSPRATAVKEMLPQLDEAIRLGGVSKLPRPAPQEAQAGGPPMAGALDPGAAEAIQKTELTPELVAGFGPILDEATVQLAKGDLDGARTNVVRVFPFVMADLQSGKNKVPAATRARAQALMGLYMQAKGAPMGAMMLQQAAGADAKTVDALGDALAHQGDPAHAKTLWQTLVQAAPDYAAQAKLADKLK